MVVANGLVCRIDPGFGQGPVELRERPCLDELALEFIELDKFRLFVYRAARLSVLAPVKRLSFRVFLGKQQSGLHEAGCLPLASIAESVRVIKLDRIDVLKIDAGIGDSADPIA